MVVIGESNPSPNSADSLMFETPKKDVFEEKGANLNPERISCDNCASPMSIAELTLEIADLKRSMRNQTAELSRKNDHIALLEKNQSPYSVHTDCTTVDISTHTASFNILPNHQPIPKLITLCNLQKKRP